MALLNEVTDSPSIPVNVSTCKPLIGHVEENKQVSFLQDKERQHLTLSRLWILTQNRHRNHLFLWMHTYLDNVRNFLPLLRPRVNTSRIVGTGMQQNHTFLWDCLSQKAKTKKRCSK